MIVQKVIKGIGGITRAQADQVLEQGILCNWWWKVRTINEVEVYRRLTIRNLYWHQNRYSEPDPEEGGEEFCKHTPFISTTAGSVQRDPAAGVNVLRPAWLVALEFATDHWTRDAFLFYCYLFVLGKRCVSHRPFSEELRELNVYTEFSRFQPEGEITAKVNIPPTQIEKYEFYALSDVMTALAARQIPTPTDEELNLFRYRLPTEVSNIRELLA